MRLRFHCQNRIGILRDIVAHFADYGLNVARGEVGGEHGNAIYLHVPNLLHAQLAKRLGVSHTTIANKLRRYGISGEA
ncbi:TyrR/PhhR family helix-turn-helix DNA-binding protein [Halomonas sp.]|uniref:TyrR/PhhR family helix-turn-helix DNA-binding protein n=1 Tax=Halomonas sp. TaxID=1486246 RepID=UPI0038601FE0